MLQCWRSRVTPFRYGHLASGMGFIQITLPAALAVRIRLASARSRLTDLASLSTSSTVFGVSTGEAVASTASRARPTLVPLPQTPEVRT